jgi:hypothetical protein
MVMDSAGAETMAMVCVSLARLVRTAKVYTDQFHDVRSNPCKHETGSTFSCILCKCRRRPILSPFYSPEPNCTSSTMTTLQLSTSLLVLVAIENLSAEILNSVVV